MPQEFLASFAVDIDEGGVNRLQSILSQNRDLAAGLAATFDSARSSMLDFVRSAAEELPSLPFFSPGSIVEEAFGTSGSFAVDLDFSRASKQLETFLASAKKQMKLSADGSAIVSAASAALSQVRSMFAGANLALKVKVEKETTESDTGGSGSSPRSAFSGFALPLAAGGRFSSPTHAEIAEDGDPEYVIPVKKEQEAVPLLRSLLSELSASARASLGDILPAADFPSTGYASAPEMLSAASAAMPVIQPSVSNNIQAPVNIHVEAASADPEAVGRSIYDTAERYLLRTLQSAV